MSFRRVSSLLSLVTLGFLSSCLSSSSDSVTPDKPFSGISFLHGAPASPALNVILDNKTINNNSFNYFAYSGYLSVDPGNHAIRFTSITDQSVQLDTTMNVTAQKSYSLFLYNKGTKMKSFLTLDEAVPFTTTSGMMVRSVHLSPDLPEVKVVLVGETKLVSDQVDFTEISTFTEFAVKSTTVEIRATSDNHLIATQTFTPTGPGQYFTIALMGYVTPPANNTNALAVQILNN